MKLSWLVLLGCLSLPANLAAQTQCIASAAPCSTAAGALQITITIGTTFDLSLSAATTDLPTPNTAEYGAGFAATDGPVATIRSNAPWALAISALTPTWSAVGTQAETPRPDKPASDLSWATSAAGPFTDLSTAPVQVTSGAPTVGMTVPLFYRTRYQWALDTPGNYSLQIVFTIAAP